MKLLHHLLLATFIALIIPSNAETKISDDHPAQGKVSAILFTAFNTTIK